MRIVISTLILFSSISAWAYIPPYWMIMARTAENHGRGTYVIDQDVVYKTSETDSQTVHETWTVTDEAHMRVSFQGVGPLKDVVKGTIVYSDRSRTINDGSIKTQHLGDDWVEPFFHFRYSKTIRNKMVQMKMAPPESLREEPPLKAEGAPDYAPPSFVRLAKLNGMVTWTIEKNPIVDGQPALWIEQDQFVVSKVRTVSKDSVDADDYSKYDGGFYAPKTRTYHWNDRSVTVQVKNVKSLGNSASTSKATMNATGLTPYTFSGSDAIRDFYLRFR